MTNDAPTLDEITELTRRELTTASTTDAIRECGRAALSLLPTDPTTCQKLAYQKLHDVPYKDVKACWRRLYTDASLWKVIELVESRDTSGREAGTEGIGGNGQETTWLDEAVKRLDMSLILTGAPDREEIVELWFSALKAMLSFENPPHMTQPTGLSDRPAKRRKLSESSSNPATPSRFPTVLPTPTPNLRNSLLRINDFSLSDFHEKIADTSKHTPMIIENAIQHWPALDERPWNKPEYLLEQTLGGRRLVPVEVGKSYTDEGWGQKIVSFKEFMVTYMLSTEAEVEGDEEVRQTGYLAQHDLFAQVPSLRADISIPDYCYFSPAPSPRLKHIKSVARLEEPLLNA